MVNSLGKKAIDLAIGAVVPAVADICIKAVDENINKPRETYISVPKLCDKNFSVTAEEAKTLIEGLGLKVTLSPMQIQEAKIKYKDCFENQVIATRPKGGSSVKPETIVFVKYITQKVINESKRLYEEQEAGKALKAEQKAALKQERNDKIKETVSNASQKAALIFKKGNKKTNISN